MDIIYTLAYIVTQPMVMRYKPSYCLETRVLMEKN